MPVVKNRGTKAGMVLIAAALAIVLGALGYFAAANTKVQRLSELTFFAGMLALLLELGQHAVRILPGG